MKARIHPLRGYFRLVERWRFRLLLALLFLTLFLQPLLSRHALGGVVVAALFGIVLAGGVRVTNPPRRVVHLGYVLAALWVATQWVDQAGMGAGLIDAPLLALTVMLGLLVLASTLRALLVIRESDIDALAGAVFGYLLLAIVWSLFYVEIEILHPGAFSFPGSAEDAGSQLLYFSLVTITTLGYGDVMPVNPFARICAGIEAVQGTLYLAILIGRVVSIFRPKER